MMRKFAKPLTLILGLGASSTLLADDLFYRYQNMRGESVIESMAPSPDIAVRYEILNEEGKVLETVQQVPDSADLSEQKAVALQKLRRQSIQDKALLAQFKNTNDIEALKAATSAELQEEIAELLEAQTEEDEAAALENIALQLQLKQLSLADLPNAFERKVKRYNWLIKKDEE